LRQKDRDYNLLNSQLLDLEHRFKLLQEEKIRMDADAREKEDLQYKKNSNLQEELRSANDLLAELERKTRDLSSDLTAHKALTDEKNGEITKIKRDITNVDAENTRLLREKRNAEADLATVKDGQNAARSEGETLSSYNNKLMEAKALEEKKLREAELEVATLSRRLREAQGELEDTQTLRIQKEKDLEVAQDIKQSSELEADSLYVKNKKLQDEKADWQIRNKDLELQVKKVNAKIDDLSVLIDSREKDARSTRLSANSAENNGLALKEEIFKFKKDNETYSLLLDKYRSDVDIQKKLREEESLRKVQLSGEKKKLEREALLKDIEARSAKKELEKIQESHDRLLDSKIQASQELDAIKQHAELLESQNTLVNILA
jgi:chromosome segregation ATPase